MSDQRTTLVAKLAAARGRLWLVAVVAVAAGLAAAAVASARAPVYAAEAQVGFGTTTVPAQASAALTPAMAHRAIRRAGIDGMSPGQLLDNTRISVDPGSGVAVVRVTDSNRSEEHTS